MRRGNYWCLHGLVLQRWLSPDQSCPRADTVLEGQSAKVTRGVGALLAHLETFAPGKETCSHRAATTTSLSRGPSKRAAPAGSPRRTSGSAAAASSLPCAGFVITPTSVSPWRLTASAASANASVRPRGIPYEVRGFFKRSSLPLRVPINSENTPASGGAAAVCGGDAVTWRWRWRCSASTHVVRALPTAVKTLCCTCTVQMNMLYSVVQCRCCAAHAQYRFMCWQWVSWSNVHHMHTFMHTAAWAGTLNSPPHTPER